MTAEQLEKPNSGTRTLKVLDNHSKNFPNDFKDKQNVEAAVFALLLKSANNIMPSSLISNSINQAKNDSPLAELKLAAITTNNFNIHPKQLKDGQASSDFPLTAKAFNGTSYERVSHNEAVDPITYFNQWTAEILERINYCLDDGAHIICLGEFDYPPETTDISLVKDFDERIKNSIDNCDRPIFLVAGTRHEKYEEGNSCKIGNYAKIFLNNKIDESRNNSITANEVPRNHQKLLCAEKAGEKIAPKQPCAIDLYKTSLGNIGVLICIDAYAPQTIFSLLYNQISTVVEADKVNYLLVPAYNMSCDLYYACQTLSLATDTVVMLVDACNKSENKKAQIELFISGKSFDDYSAMLNNSAELSDEGFAFNSNKINDKTAKIWSINCDTIRQSFIKDFSLSKRMPFFHKVSELLKNDLAKNESIRDKI